MLAKFLLTVLLLGSFNVFAHEGHDNAPGSLRANHGGKVEPGKEINLEYVVTGTEVKLFPASHEGKDLSTSDVKLSATAKRPKDKAEPVTFEVKEGAFVTNVDFKTAYRVEMKIEAITNGKKSTFKLQIEK